MPNRATPPRLTDIPLFAGLSAAEQDAMTACSETLTIERGDVLVAEGDLDRALYLVIAGRFGVGRAGCETRLTEIGPGQPIGEIGFLTGTARTATVTALRDSVVLKLERAAFDDIATRFPDIWPALSGALATRLAETSALARPTHQPLTPRCIAIIPAGNAPMPRAFVDRLTSALASLCHPCVLASLEDAGLAGDGNTGAQDQAQATARLSDIEAETDLLVLIAHDDGTAWPETAIRHADQVIAVGTFSGDPAPGRLDAIARRFVPPEMHRLVLLHPTRRRITGTSRWLAPRMLAMHHHVADDSTADIMRLARFIRGTARGLVACGGGALCAAHIGVHEALTAQSMTFDIMGGTSAGSAMAAGFILGTNPDDMERAVHDMFVARRAMSRYTLPRYSLLDHTNFDRQLAAFFGGMDIEDLWLPFFAVSTNLSRNSTVVHRQGDLFTAIRASASIPVMLPPVYTEDGEMLVDGCLLDNVPVQAMHALKRGPNVIVSFSLPDLKTFDVAYEDLPSRARLARAAIDPFARRALPDAPNIVTVLMRSLMVGRQDFQRHVTGDDLLIQPELPASIGYLGLARSWRPAADRIRGGDESNGLVSHGVRRARRLLLAECPRQMVGDGLGHVRQSRARARYNHGLDGHARDERQLAELGHFLIRHTHARRVIGKPRVRVCGHIRGETRDLSFDFRRGALIEGGETQKSGLPDRHLIDIRGRQSNFDGLSIFVRHDRHECIARSDDAADCVHGQFVDHAGSGRTDFDATQNILRRNSPLRQFAQTGLDFPQFPLRVRFLRFLNFQDLQFRLADLPSDARDLCQKSPMFALDARHVALHGQNTGRGQQLLAIEHAQPLHFPGHEFEFAALGPLLLPQPHYLALQLADAGLELGRAAGRRLPPRAEQALFTCLDAFDVEGCILSPRCGDQICKAVGKIEVLRTVALGEQANLAAVQLQDLRKDDAKICPRLGIVQPHQNVAGGNLVAAFNPDFAHHAAGRMLDLLETGFHHDTPRRDDGAGNFGAARPATHSDDQSRDEPKSGQQARAQIFILGIVTLACQSRPKRCPFHACYSTLRSSLVPRDHIGWIEETPDDGSRAATVVTTELPVK